MNDHYIPDDRTEELDAVREKTEIPETAAIPEEPTDNAAPVAQEQEIPAETAPSPAADVGEEISTDIPEEVPSPEEEIATAPVAEEIPVAGLPLEDISSEEPDSIPEESPSFEEPAAERASEEVSFSDQFFTESEPDEFHSDSLPELISEEKNPSEEEVTDIILDTLAEEALEAATPEEIETLISEESPIIPIQQPAPTPRRERPMKKTRPRRKKGDGLLSIPHMLPAVIWLLIIVAIGTSMGRIIWVCAADVLAFGRESREVSISITADDTLETIADKLHKAGLINIPELFLFYADIADVEEDNKITTGTFTLNTIYDYNALVNHMGPRATNRVVIEDVLIPEGYSCRQIFALLEEKGICKASDLEAYAASGELDDYWFLKDVQRGDRYCLEGFLFPDTYDFYENSTPRLALEKMLDGFQYRFSQELHDQLPVLNEQISGSARSSTISCPC